MQETKNVGLHQHKSRDRILFFTDKLYTQPLRPLLGVPIFWHLGWFIFLATLSPTKILLEHAYTQLCVHKTPSSFISLLANAHTPELEP